jgi:ABC-type multidrug transport system fused ATPase/permease subunit
MKYASRHQGGEEIVYPLTQFLKDIKYYVTPYQGSFFGSTLLRVVSDIASLYNGYAIGRIVTLLAEPGIEYRRILMVVVTLAAALGFRYLTLYFSKRLNNFMAARVHLNIQMHMIEILFARDSAWHEKESSGNKIKRITNGADGYSFAIRTWINNIIEIFVRFVSIPIILFKVDMRASLLMAFFIVSYFIISYFLAKPALRAAYQASVDEESVHGVAFEAVSNIRSIQVLGLAEGILRAMQDPIQKLFESYRRRVKAMQFRSHFIGAYAEIYRAAAIGFIAYQVFLGHYEVGFLVTFASYFFNMWESVKELSDVSQDLTVAQQSVGRMHALIGRSVQEVEANPGDTAFPNEWKEISLNQVSFAYEGNEVLSDVSFKVQRGEKIGIVGLSGAGKSTLFKLLLKERMNWKGEISIDGIPLEKIKTSDYRKRVSVVLQDTEVFNLTLRQNILLGSSDSIDTDLTQALTVAHVKDFLQKLPQGLDTVIGEKGVKLSGGEKQRLGIARAVVRKPEILFLDEATSHLDLESEEKIKQSLHEFFQSVTAIVIAHRLTTIREMDRIIVIEGGRVVEEGNFETLHKKEGRFYELWEKQRLH